MKNLYYLLFAALFLVPDLVQAQDGSRFRDCADEEGDLYALVNIVDPEFLVNSFCAGYAQFGDTTSLRVEPLEGLLVLGQGPTGEGITPDMLCGEATNAGDLAGNIAFANRGACSFSLKAYYAQQAGALGLVIGNNDQANPDQIILMAAGDSAAAVTIPTLSISYNSAQVIMGEIEFTDITVEMIDKRDPIVAIEDDVQAHGFALTASYPNPFATRSQFELMVDRAQNVRVALYDLLGREVAVLHEGAVPAGVEHRVVIDASNLPSGTYLYRAVGETFAQTKQVTVVK